ncbi:hypothetical protein [Polaromonas sp. SM01]|uniref:hypothetical protein n=1 Tax=Polaromonas sp. SM01 TaxID=3085630 RepID=UPI0029820741|nr:hypothetical protein [Polaromonas sp. SM01]MDW5441657.1 hypothetical protein [Polaromonas sp. SM01]
MRLQTTVLGAGVIQGLIFWWLWHALKLGHWPATEPLAYTALLYAAFAVPLVIYCLQGIARFPAWLRRAAALAYLVVYAALGAYAAWASGATGRQTGLEPANVLAALVLGFVSLSLLCGFDVALRRWNYARLFNYTWRNGILLVTAAAMTGAAWLVLFAGASLMALIGVKQIKDLITEPAFIFPVTSLVFAAAFSLGLARAAMAESIRRFWLSISSWLLPLVLFFGVLWAAAVPFTGLDPLFKTKSAALIMLWFAALAVKFSNCAYQDGEISSPYPPWLARATQAAWLSLLPVVAIAWWALGLRVAQHGLSEQRLWAGLVAAIAAIYAVGYALSWLKAERWIASIARTNIVAAIVLCLGLLAFLTPLADIQRLAVSFHVRHVTAAHGAIEPDWNYLRWRSGRFGREALQGIAASTDGPTDGKWQKQATSMLAQTRPFETAPTVVSEAYVQEKLRVFPRQQMLPASFLKHVQASKQDWMFSKCLEASASCVVWLGDLNNDGQNELLLFNSERQMHGTVFTQSNDTWKQAGNFSSRGSDGKFDSARLEDAHIAQPDWSDLVVDGKRLRLQLNQQ